jgi:hypothetical protein
MLEENYIGYNLYERLAETLAPLVRDYAYPIIKLMHQVKEPHLAWLQLYFEIHSGTKTNSQKSHFRKMCTESSRPTATVGW